MKNLLILFLMCFALSASAQITGVVTDSESGSSLPGVNVVWLGTTDGTVTDASGNFVLELSKELPSKLVISYVGFNRDTVQVSSVNQKLTISLSTSVQMQAVEIIEDRNAFTMSAASKMNTESINRAVLRKAACCNLSETFETTASVDVVLNDAVTGTRKIQMLGLAGVYVQNLFEGVPFTRGLGNVLGFDQIPGPWINSIQLTKGAGTILNGNESMTGQINLEFLPSDGNESVYFDLFGNNQGRYEGNFIWTKPINDKWSTAFFASGNYQDQKVDQNGDGFLDMPTREGLKLLNRWKYKGDLFRSQVIAIYTTEERTSGQKSFDFDDDFGSENSYGFGLDVEQIEIIAKAGILSEKRMDRSVGIRSIYSNTRINSYFGNNPYDGEENSARISALFTQKFSEFSDHSMTVGGQFLYDDYQESYIDSTFNRTERVPGVFAEYTYDRPRFTLVLGARYDAHNIFGNQFSPRAHAKYNLRPLTTFRATIGKGFRSANAFGDQLGLLASSRQVRVLDTPQAEESWNTGLSFLHKFELFGRQAVINTDYYFTSFQNQLVIDRDFDANQLLFYNLDGESYAHSWQADFQVEPLKGLGMKFSYKYQLVETEYLEGKLQSPLIPKHRALFNVGYTSPDRKWYVDFTTNYYGASRLPGTEMNPENLRAREESETFFIMNTQITRTLGNFEVYAGAENLGNFIQSDAIVDAENPFVVFFDATMIYGPLNGRTVYLGVRFNLEKQSK
jgi:outer membrane receptor for ferrienterochelin and colicins